MIDDPEFFDCCFQRGRLIVGFDDPDERAGRSLDGAVNFPLDGLLGHGLMPSFRLGIRTRISPILKVPSGMLHIAQQGGSRGQGGSAGTYLGVWVPGVVTTPIGALSSPASMAARMAAQNASSMLK